jgi:hypothetical protein
VGTRLVYYDFNIHCQFRNLAAATADSFEVIVVVIPNPDRNWRRDPVYEH